MFCTVNDCEIYFDESDESKPKLLHKNLRYVQVQVFKVLIEECAEREKELEELI